MRLPNGYGSVYKLSGNRRKPYAARLTVGWSLLEEEMKSYPIYKFIGYYATKKEALQALANYNEDPYDLHYNTITFAEVYDKWSDVHFEKIKDFTNYKSAYKACKPLWDMKFVDIKLVHLQNCIDQSGKNTPMLKVIKVMWGLMWDYAVMHEIVPPDKREMVRYVDIKKPGNPNAIKRTVFNKNQIKQLWEVQEGNPYISVILIMIYTGLRIGELLSLKKEDVHLEERYFEVKVAKTEAGIREVPICEKIVPFFDMWIQTKGKHLITSPTGKMMPYHTYYDTYWKPLMSELGMDEHRPHDTRHTCVSLLTEAYVDERIIKKIVGHKGQGITQAVYTHLDLKVKLEAINKI